MSSEFTLLLYFRPSVNDPSLLLACEYDNYQVVQAFVKRGFRLAITSMYSEEPAGHAMGDKHYWKDMVRDMPGFLTEEQCARGDEDEVFNLFVLRMMARPSYILACYTVVAEEKDLDDRGEVRESYCECPSIHRRHHHVSSSSAKVETHFHLRAAMPKVKIHNTPFEEAMGLHNSTDGVPFHFCPASERYVPKVNCPYHVECNDPIYRCFELARAASEAGKRLPEYRSEFYKIASSCRKLSAAMIEG